MHISQRIIVYSSGNECQDGKLKQKTILGLFDSLGNGVVYDYNGNARLKYNQSEGVIIDPKLGYPARWQWHTLNEPPVLQQVYVDEKLAVRDPVIDKLTPVPKTEPNESAREAQAEMLQIELDNFVHEKNLKLTKKFEPFKIKMKAVKLNDYFALKILDQSNIYLMFRDGSNSMKLCLGMYLKSDEIIDSDVSEVADVATPYDKSAKSESVANIQNELNKIRKMNTVKKQTSFGYVPPLAQKSQNKLESPSMFQVPS